MEKERPFEEVPRPNETINVMPDKETLEEFIKSMHGEVTVYFDRELGEFVWVIERPKK